jgi:hypothetical protein
MVASRPLCVLKPGRMAVASWVWRGAGVSRSRNSALLALAEGALSGSRSSRQEAAVSISSVASSLVSCQTTPEMQEIRSGSRTGQTRHSLNGFWSRVRFAQALDDEPAAR